MNIYRRGVTLIEVVIYLALFGLLIGGAVVAAFNVLESASRGQTKAMLQEEGGYLQKKIEWTLSGARTVSIPSIGSLGETLSVTKWDVSIGNPVAISLVGTDVRMSKRGGAWATLNNSNVLVSGLLFSRTKQSGVGTNPERIEFSFSVSARAPNGMMVAQFFPTTTIVVRQ